MFNKLVADLLTSHLGEYFENIDREHVKVSVWNGLVHMRNLKVRQDALRFLDVPVCVLMGAIEELTVVIPWTHLRSESVVVQIRKAQLILADKETAGYSIDQDVREARARKIRELAATDEALLMAFREGLLQASSSAPAPTSVPPPTADAADSSDSNFTARLKASILNNIRVEVEEVWVHYTSCVAGAAPGGDDVLSGGVVGEASTLEPPQGHPQHSMRSPPSPSAHADASVQLSTQQASLSFQIKEITTCGCNERFEPAFVTPGERMARQLISLRGLAASLRTSTSSESEVSLLKPFDMAVELAYQPVYTDVSTPQYMAAVRMDDACSCIITSERCTTCYGLVQYLVHVRQRQALRRLRPIGERLRANPRAWWRYTLDAVRQQVQNNRTAALASARKLTPFSWLAYTSMKQKRDRYMRLYLRQQRISLRATGWLEPLTVDEHVELVALEDELSIDVLKLGKRLAMRRVGVERVEYEKLLREKRAVGGAGETDTPSPVRPSAPPAQMLAPVVKSGWFSFWRSESQPTASASVSASGAANDGLSEEARAELRELVQLMTAEQWTDAQRAVIAQELGMSPEEAKALSRSDTSLPASNPDPATTDLSKKPSRHRSVPSCAVFLHAKELRVELQSRALSAPSTPSLIRGKVAASTTAPDTLAQVALHTLQAGVEWGGVSAASGSALQAAYYWGAMERFSITAASLAAPETRQSTHASTEEVILAIRRTGVRRDCSQSDSSCPLRSTSGAGSPRTPAANMAEREASVYQSRLRTFSPLEFCWSIVPDECRRHAAVKVEWTVRSAQQLTSRTSALHCVRVGLALVHVVIDVVPLRHLSDFLFTMMWPETALSHSAASGSVGDAQVYTSPPIDANVDGDFTALALPVSPRMTYAEQRCATDEDARLVVLRRRVEQQRSIDWSVAVDAVHISLSEVPQVQGCELALTQLCLRNDAAHRLQLQGRLRREASEDHSNASTSPTTTTTAAAALGSLDTDWIDCTHVRMAAARLSVFFPRNDPSADGPLSIERGVLLPDTAIAAVVERSLLGRCHPNLPQWNLRMSSSDAVNLAWSRTSLSVLTTACTMLTDLAASVESNIQERGARQIGAAQSPEGEAVYTCRVRVLPHTTGKRFWYAAHGHQSAAGDVDDDAPPHAADELESFYKKLHPFSAARQHSTVVAAVSLPQRVSVRRGVCVVYHAQRSTFPAQYYTLQDGCTHVLLDGERDSGVTAAASVTAGPCVHLYVSQGGRNHEEALASGYRAAKRFLIDKLRVPPALLGNAFWLKHAVKAWLEKGNAVEGDNTAPSQQQARKALSRVLAGTQTVPCRYIAFQCASDAEARAFAAALRRCCVAAATPPLLLRPSVQARYNAAVSAPELRKQPLYGVTVSFPSLRMTCEGSEPAVCSDALKTNSDTANACRSPRRDAVVSFTPFLLRHDCYRDKQSYELSVADSVALCARFGGNAAHHRDVKLFDVSVPSSSSASDISGSRTARDSSAFSMRFVNYRRPSPLPPSRRCTTRVGPSARMCLRAGPTLLECGEAFWDTMGLLTNRLFGAEVIAGYPWWRSLGSDEDTRKEEVGEGADVSSRITTDVEVGWGRTSECGGNALCNHVDVTVPALQVNVDLEGAANEPMVSMDIPVLRFKALGAVLECRMTEACNHVRMTAESPQLQWCCPSATGAVPGKANWVTLMQPDGASTPSESRVDSAKLSVDWKQNRPPPMLSFSDWLCGRDGGGEGVEGACVMGIRDQQELKVEVRRVRLLFLYPLLMHLLGSVREGLVERASAVVAREPCWFCAGTLLCPPLLWRAPEKATAAVSWTHVRKSVTLQSVVLQTPRPVDWLAQAATSAPLPSPAPHLLLAAAHLLFTDRVQVPASSSTSDQSPAATAVNIVYDLHSSDMVISHAQPSSGAPFQWRLPSWHVNIAHSVFDARCLWAAGVPRRKSFAVVLPSPTESCVLRCSSADLSHVMDVVYANFFRPTAFGKEMASDAVDASSPASLLKAVAEESTWTLSVKGEAALCISTSRSDSSHSGSQSMQCLLRLNGAAASAMRSASGELSCSFAAQQVWLGCGAPSTATWDLPESDGLCILQVAPLPSAAATPAASLTVQCSWRWLATPKVDSSGATDTAAPPEREVFLSVDSFGAVTATVNGEAAVLLRAIVVDDRHLRESLLRYMEQAPLSASRAGTPTPSHESRGDSARDGRAKQVGRIRLQHLECRIPCSAAPAYSPSSAAPTPSTPVLVLSCAVSRVQVELCRKPNASYAMVRVARLVRCVLEDTRSGGSVVTAIPLALEQPTEWQVPVAASPRPRRHASPHARVASGSSMEPPKPKDASLLDEVFGQLQVAKQDSALPTKATSPESDVLYVALEDAPMQCKVILDLQPLWLFAPSVMHAAAMLDGVCTQVKLCAAALLRDSAAPASPQSITTTTASELHRSYALQLRSGSIALLVGETEVAVSATPGYPSVSLAAAIRQAVDEQEMLVVATEAATVAWNAEIQERTCFDGAQTILHLESISISAIRGMEKGTVLLERFGIRVQRRLMQSGESFESSAAAATGGIEEWRLGMDALQLTLTQLHYTALLRVALQQTSFLAAIMKYFSSASQSIAAAATAPDLSATAAPQQQQQHRSKQTNSPANARRYLFHLSSLRLRVHADNGDDGSDPPTAVYFELSELDAAYYAGQHNWSGIADAGDDLNERGVSLRLVVTLASCLLGTENVIPTLALTAASCHAVTQAARKSCSLRVAQEEQTKAYRGALQAGQVTVTVEAVPMMAWVDLLYTPYLQVTVPGYQSAKELVVQQDLWLSEDLLLSERTPLRVTNKLYSLVYLYGNGHTIHMNASGHGQLIFLEEGVTLRIMNATVCMTALSIEAYVAAGNGSYVVIDPATCSAVPPPSALERDAAGVVRAAVLQMDHQRRTAAEESTKAFGEVASPRWQRFIGEVQVELRIPEPRSVAGAASVLCASTGHAATTWAQRTLVLYTDMNLCLVNSRSAATDEDELTGAFDLAHAGVRSEYCTQHGGTAVDTSDLVSDWAMKVLMTEEKRRCTDRPAGLPVRLGTIHVSASTGVEVRVRYSDAVFVARAVRHAQVAASRWQDAVRRDVWSGLSSLHGGWDAVETDGEASVGSLVRARHSRGGGEARNALAASAGAETTVVTVLLQIPYVSLFIIDDSQDNDTPLFCFYANEIHTPHCALESLHTSAELCFVLQLEYYELSRSQWAPVLEPVEVKVSFSSRKNASVMDLYDRKGYARLSTRMSSVKLCFSSEMLRNVRQLLLLRDMFESAGVDALAMRGTSDGGVASASVFHAFKMVQTIGLDVVVQLPEYVENPQSVQRRASDSHDDDAASTRARVLQVGQEWEFNLPRYRGKELPLEHQKIIVQQQQQQQERPSTAPTSKACGAVISLASVGVQRVTMATSGPLQRYILADVSVALERQGQKQVLLHTLATFTNRLSMPLLQVVVNASGTYDAVGVVPPASSQCVPVQVLRRRVTLALGNFADISTSSPALTQMRLSADSIVSLGMSYDSLPCLAGTVLLCVCNSVHGSRGSASRGSGAGGVARIAVGKNFVVLSGQPGKTYFLLRMQAAARQPADVLRHPSLSPLRSVIVTAEAVVTIRNAVGVPLTVTLLTRRTQPGRRISLLDTSPDTAVYTCVSSVVVGVDGSYGATEMDPLEDVCLGVSLQQPNGVTLAQWSTAPAGGIPTAQHPPACVHAPLDKTRRDTKLVLVDPVTNATLVLAIKYAQREVTLYCPYWIFNETDVPVQLADTTRPHHGDTERCIAPIAGLSGRMERAATVSPWKFSVRGGGTQLAAVHAGPFLYHSLRAESCHNDKNHAGSNGLFLRLLEPTEAGTRGGAAQALWSDWSSQPLLVHETAEVQVIVCASRHKRGAVWVLSCRVEMGHQASVRAYSDTRVVSIRPRWVLVNKSPYALRFSQHSSSGGYHPPAPTAQTAPFAKAVVSTLVAPAMADGRAEPLLSFAMCDDKAHNIEQCLWSPPFAIHTVQEQYVNLVYQTRRSLAEHWPQTSAKTGQRTAQGVVDRLPPLRPEDILEVGRELFVRLEEAKVFSVRTYEHKGCMMCVQVEEAVQPPLVLENRTSFTVCFRQRGARRVSTVFPRRRKAWTWDAPPAAGRLPAEVELWVLTDGVDGSANSAQKATPAAAASCVLNFDPQQIGCRSSTIDAFQCELDVGDSAAGASSLLFVRVRGVHGISYAVSITMEPTIDVYRTLPFPQVSLALHLASMYVLCRTTGKREGQLQDMWLLAIQPVDFSFAQGARVSNDASRPSATGSYEDANEDGDVQQIQLRFRSLQVDDERPSAKQRVVAQLVDDRESGFQIERKLLRITPIIYCSVVAAWLTPVELHIEDGFVSAMMGYVEEVESSWETLRPSSSCKRIDSSSAAEGGRALLLPWQAHLERELIAAKQHFAEAQEDSGQTLRHWRRSSVSLWSRVVAIQRLLVDPLLVSLSLYRSPGAADDPLWKLAGAASLLIGSTQDSRLQWDAVQRRNVCDTIWHLAFLYRDSYVKQMKGQYMSLVNIMGLDTVRSFVSDLLNPFGDEHTNRYGGGNGGRGAVRRQKQRVPCRRAANLMLDYGTGGTRSFSSGAAASLRRASVASASAGRVSDDMREMEEASSATTSWLLRVPERVVRVSSQRTATVAEVARSYAWHDFMAVAQTPEIRAFGGCALAHALAEMRWTPRYSLQSTEGSGWRQSASDFVRVTLDPRRRGAEGCALPRVDCSRCAELEALREARLRSRERTPLPHPVHDGFLTWEEFAHHINWYEFVDMCSDEEVRTYAPLVCQGASEASCNVCILTAL